MDTVIRWIEYNTITRRTSVTSSPDSLTVTPSPDRLTVTPSPDRLTVTPSPDGLTVTSSPDRCTVTPSPDGLTVTSSPDRHTVTPSPDGLTVTPLPDILTWDTVTRRVDLGHHSQVSQQATERSNEFWHWTTGQRPAWAECILSNHIHNYGSLFAYRSWVNRKAEFTKADILGSRRSLQGHIPTYSRLTTVTLYCRCLAYHEKESVSEWVGQSVRMDLWSSVFSMVAERFLSFLRIL